MTPTNTSNLSPETETPAASTDVIHDTTRKAPPSRKKRNSVFLPELVAMVLSGLALLSIVFIYFGGFLPAREELKHRQQTRNQLEKQLQEMQARSNDFHTKENDLTAVVNSVSRFEETYLPITAQGNSILYERINQLIRANNLRNTAGPEYAPIAAVSLDKAPQNQRNNMQESLFPGTTVTLTVEGSYANLRHFIADLENTRQFLVINSIEIESNGDKNESAGGNDNPLSSQNQPMVPNNPRGNIKLPNNPNNLPGAAGANPNRVQPRLENPLSNGAPIRTPADQAPKARANSGGSVSLRLEMAAYFKRPLSINEQN